MSGKKVAATWLEIRRIGVIGFHDWKLSHVIRGPHMAITQRLIWVWNNLVLLLGSRDSAELFS
jgi:hypothetical protein